MQTRLRNKLWLLAAAALTLFTHNRAAADDPRTMAECNDAYDQCFANAGFWGYFFCPQAYAQCVAQVRRQLPPEVTQTLGEVDACMRAEATCRTAAEGASDKLAGCARNENVCVVRAFGLEPTPEEKKDRLCVQTAVRCLNATETASDLGACQQALRHCLDTPVPPL